MRHFSRDNFQNLLNTASDLVLLNLAFLLSCLPILTIGAGVCGMYHVNFKTLRGEGGGVWKTYWSGFRASFRNATLLWLLILAIAGILTVDVLVLPQMLPQLYLAAWVVVGIAFLLLTVAALYSFPLEARFHTPLRQTLKNALLLAVAHFPHTLALLLLHALPVVCCLLSEQLFLNTACLFLVCGFSLVNFIASHWLSQVFSSHET